MLQEMDYMENNYTELKKADDNFTVRSQSVDRRCEFDTCVSTSRSTYLFRFSRCRFLHRA